MKAEDESPNGEVIWAFRPEVRVQRSVRAHEEIMRIREQIRGRTGTGSGSVSLIRALREDTGRRD